MIEQSPPQSNTKFAPFGLAKEAYRIVFANPRDMMQMLWLGVVVSSLSSFKVSALQREAVAALGANPSDEDFTQAMFSAWDDPWMFIHVFASVVVLCGVFVSLHRYVLLGTRPPRFLGVAIGAREGRYLGYLIASWFLLVFAAFAAGAVFSLIASLLAALIGGADQQQMKAVAQMMMPPGLAGTIIVLGVVYARIGLAMPAIALDAPGGPVRRFRAAWQVSRGHILRLFTLVVLTTVPLIGLDLSIASAFSAPPGEFLPWPVEALAIVMSTCIAMLGYAVTTNAFSLAFRHLHKPDREPYA